MTDLAGKRILVTGGAGFLGRQVCRLLHERHAGALIVPRSIDCDLTEQESVAALFAAERPDLVLHLAAEVGGIGANRAHPGRYFYANMAMGLHVIEASRRAGVDKVVHLAALPSVGRSVECRLHLHSAAGTWHDGMRKTLSTTS